MRDYGASLEAIERMYGSVAEYNRCMEEERWDYSERNYQRFFNDDDCYDEENVKPNIFEVGGRYIQFGFYGGITTYIVKEIDRENNKILLAEEWQDVDGTGIRPAKWHKLETTEDGNERCLDWTSKEYGDIWIYA